MAAKESERTVGDYVTLQRGNTYSGKLVGETGPALLGLGSIEPGGGFRHDKYKSFGGDCPPKIMLQPGDLYVALKGATKDGSMVGSIARLPATIPSGRLTQDTARLDFRDKNIEVVNHLYWVLRTPQYRQYCAGRVTGSAAASFSREDFLSYPVPTITDTSKTLVSVFEAIEMKVEVNRRINETLAAITRAIFKDWFIDFEPTRAKAEGRPAYLAPEVWSFFPGGLDEEGKPKGWDCSEIGKETRCVGGSTPSTTDPSFWNGGVQWATPKDLSALNTPVLLSTERTISERGLEKISSGLLPVRTVLLSSRAPIGYLAIAEVPVAINQGFIALVPEGRLSSVFVWQWVLANMEAILQKANGSTFQEISKGNFRPLPVVVPSAPLLKTFDAAAQPLYERIRGNEIETRSLVALRDFLLPKLISGEIRLQDAEKLARKVS